LEFNTHYTEMRTGVSRAVSAIPRQPSFELPDGRMNQGNGFPPATAVHSEAIQIGGDHRVFRMQLAESNKAQIRKIGPPIGKARR
jgi:hypothetical protein